ncbi:MAG TPA: tripartite tricarboxylate transporter substrate binding protein [Xanthobacteraceae bacterium]
MKRFPIWLLGACFFAACLMPTRPASAEPIKIVVPFAAGGPVDQLARVLANGLGPKLGEDVIVDDRGGAGGAIACEFVARANPDGKTVLLASLGAFVIGPVLKPPANYDPVKSFEPIMLVGSVPSLIVVNPKSGIATLADLIAKAKQRPLSYGSAGLGTTMNIALEMLNKAAGVKITHVPYRGAAPAITDLLGGHIDTLNADLPVLLPLVKAGKVKALAVFSPERTPLLPDLPTTKEAGVPGMIMENWYGLLFPAGTPKDVRDRIERAAFAVIATPAIKARFAADGTHGALDHDAFAAMLSKQFAEWPQRIKTLGISAE